MTQRKSATAATPRSDDNPLRVRARALRLVGFSARDAGYIDNIEHPSPGGTYTNADVAEDDVNTAEVWGGRAQLRWQVN